MILDRGPDPGVRQKKHIFKPHPLWFLLVVLVLCPNRAGADAGTRTAPPPWLNLTREEAELWTAQGVGQPAPHLLGQSAERAAGTVTELKLVAILVDFPDAPADRVNHPREYFEQMLFGRGPGPDPSVAEFLSRSSRGRLEVTGEVRGWFTTPFEKGYYTNRRGGLGYYPLNSQGLAETAMTLADVTINYAHYDNEGPDGVPDSGDDDELVDGVIIVHAGQGRETGGGTVDDFVSLHWWTPNRVPVDGVFGRYFTLNPEEGNVGIYLHELGHLLGLPDLYDTDGGSYGLGAWSLMSGGSNLDLGKHPADFDAWSKTQLGFVDVLSIQDDQVGFVVPPSTQGQVVRLWKSGLLGTEYFLLENRLRTGLDAYLPGEGLLVYHVDDTIPSNRTPNHYKVALEQADGLYQLENRFNDPSVGDAGDPYHAGDVFGRFTDPSSLAYDGTDSFVHIFNIQGPDPEGNYTADLNVREGPLIEVVDLNLTELVGNGDGFLSPGEEIGVAPRIQVSRQPATGLVIRAESLDPLGTLQNPDVTLGAVGPGQVVDPPEPFRVVVDPGILDDPYGLKMSLELSWDGAPPRTIPLELGIGSIVGREDDFEVAPTGWTHEALRPTAFDQWTYSAGIGENGTAGYRYGFLSGGYLRNSDGVLVSPPVLLPRNATLLFDHLVDIQSPNPIKPQAGGIVEISVNGGDWQQIAPEGGYPRSFLGDYINWKDRPIYAGTLAEAKFQPARFDLSEYSGSLRVRFHFFAEVQVSSGFGWRIDNVRIVDDLTPVQVLHAGSEIHGEDVRLSWSLGEPIPTRVRWKKGPDPAAAAVPVGAWQQGAPEGTLVDFGGARDLPADYWLEALERDGSLTRWGPLHVEAGPVIALPLAVDRNPSRGSVQFSWGGELPRGAALEIFDVRGAVVFETTLSRNPGTYTWDGATAGGKSAAPGIYFARIRNTEFKPVRVVRLP